ncbi:VRR-NUC domain-containing protein [Halomonas sp. SpR1]|uniref:VRR-NUC domain-containing protein n=1 Tax=Halomonas sp. SpR1 TaxID=3050462 RepID=UPI0027E59582|nr:VRR-NUC domain-containing protein [Halomonas sp. SpR1]MDQ7733782.1 VRR-NUC domain-containing protein [Halomonas sp. SpR1]
MSASEHQEQVALFKWAEYGVGRWPALELLYAIPNGGMRPSKERTNKRGRTVRYSVEAQKLRAEGVKSGVPDICLPVPRGPYHGLYIELKTRRGRPSEAQRQWIAALRRHGYRAEVCRGWEAARAVIEDYLGTEGGAVPLAAPDRPITYPAPRPERLGERQAKRMPL